MAIDFNEGSGVLPILWISISKKIVADAEWLQKILWTVKQSPALYEAFAVIILQSFNLNWDWLKHMAQEWDKKYTEGDVNASLTSCLEKLPLLRLLYLLYTKDSLIHVLLTVVYQGNLYLFK